MAELYEVFDNEEVQYFTRRQASHLSSVVVMAVAVTLVCVGLGLTGRLPLPLVGLVLVLSWFFAVRWVSYRLRMLRRIVWCVKLSEQRLVGYDYARRKTDLPWSRVDRVELGATGLLVRARPGSLEIPHLFPDFATLSHRVVYHAERWGVPVFIDGQPWQALDVYELFPFLTDGAASVE